MVMMMMMLGGALVYISFLARLVFAQTSLCVVLAPKYLVLVFPKYQLSYHHNTAAYIMLIQNSSIRQASMSCLYQNTKCQYYQDTTFKNTYPAPYQHNVLCWYRNTQ